MIHEIRSNKHALHITVLILLLFTFFSCEILDSFASKTSSSLPRFDVKGSLHLMGHKPRQLGCTATTVCLLQYAVND